MTAEREKILLEACSFAGLSTTQVGFVRHYLDRDPSEWASCCGSYCDPCVQTILRAVEEAKKLLRERVPIDIGDQKHYTQSMRTVQCIKLGREAEALDKPPFRNDLGERIFQQVSKDGWKEWLKHSTMLINEYLRGTPLSDKKAQEFLHKQCEEFFFGNGGEKPKDYVAPEDSSSDKTVAVADTEAKV